MNLELINRHVAAAEAFDWGQVVRNFGPPCFYLEDDGGFCGRAERWEGHHCKQPIHNFVSLSDLIKKLI